MVASCSLHSLACLPTDTWQVRVQLHVQENKCSHTDSISPFLAAEGAMHEKKSFALIRSLASLIMRAHRPCARQILDTEVDTHTLLLL